MRISLLQRHSIIPGVFFTFIIAGLGFLLAKLPGMQQVGPLAISIFIAVLFRHFFGFPEVLKSGTTFSAKRLLRAAIILFGLQLNINLILAEGVTLIMRDLLVIILSIGLMMALAKWLKADRGLSLLLGIGTGVCGASAIAAVSPILEAKERDTALSAGIISIIGTIFAIVYTLLRPFLPVEAEAFGMWAGLSLHEVAHAVLAGEAGGEDSLAMALLAKLGRVFLLVPLSLLLIWVMKHRKNKSTANHSIPFPWFLIGFIVMSLIGSFIITPYLPNASSFLNLSSSITSFILTMAMAGLGLNVSLNDLTQRAWKPLMAVTATSIVLSAVTALLVFS
ncbi:YeiH family protein [Halobacillus sp. Marseille-Q1614]|uniref:YeiH family protein n=1 Tax=Halobacillus sp. Marseille-Q1614 TaxID=2709134 RepID=UPI00156F0A62|nr:putative sulfate exporter family transporter [Halobacillus sp. Marseille-Q1614]